MTAALPLLLCLSAGCASTGQLFTPPWKKTTASKDVEKSDTYLYNELAMERDALSPEIRGELDAARQLYGDKKFKEAEAKFSKLSAAESSGALGGLFDTGGDYAAGARFKAKYPRSVCEEALFYEGECQREQGNYRDAHNTYTKLLVNFRTSQYTKPACQGLFQIADHWLLPTRNQMKEYQAQVKGERWFVTPAAWFHLSKDMPTMDAEGHALNILNNIFLHDINGPLGEKALLWLGTIHFYRKDYKEADFYFTKLYQDYPYSEQAGTALKQSVICAQLQTGGSVYDCRGLEKSKELLMTGRAAYQELAQDKEWVGTQLVSINMQQADRDFKIAQFYQRTGHPGSAYFYYELVRRRYPTSSYAAEASTKMNEIRTVVEAEQRRNSTPMQPAAPTDPNRPAGDTTNLPPAQNINPPPRSLPPGVQ